MGILTDDDGLVDAALSEMLSLPLDQRVAMDPHHDLNGLLVKHHLGQVSDAYPSSPWLFNGSILSRETFQERSRKPRRGSLRNLRRGI